MIPTRSAPTAVMILCAAALFTVVLLPSASQPVQAGPGGRYDAPASGANAAPHHGSPQAVLEAPPAGDESRGAAGTHGDFKHQGVPFAHAETSTPVSTAPGTSFTYQGRLTDGDEPASGVYDLMFLLWDAAEEGNQVSSPVTVDNRTLTDGLFTVELDFGPGALIGEARWLEIRVKRDADLDYEQLDPRQRLAPAPMALALPGLWTQQNGVSPNLIGGYSGNWVTDGVYGATVSGGGTSNSPNSVTDHGGTIGGGEGNQAGSDDGLPDDSAYATVAGGVDNTASNQWTTVGGGTGNAASGESATVGGGALNSASGDYVTIGGGSTNTASAPAASIGGGYLNTASGRRSTIGGGAINTASAFYATIGGGHTNQAGGERATIGGGQYNAANGDAATVAGGNSNHAGAWAATISGGVTNTVTGDAGFVGGGYQNVADGHYAAVVGGRDHAATGDDAAIGGGAQNTATDEACTVGGGWGNRATASHATVGGGLDNQADAEHTTIGGGQQNAATGPWATVGGGHNNQASSEDATVGGGDSNQASGDGATIGGGTGNLASGEGATVSGGWDNQAQCGSTVAGGYQHSALGWGAAIGGGWENECGGEGCTVGGGAVNTASGSRATVGGGSDNTAGGDWATIGGGILNMATGFRSTIGGGDTNDASGWGSTLAGGFYNVASGQWATVGGGSDNAANGDFGATVSGGESNTASGGKATVGGGSGNVASGHGSTVPGGSQNRAEGDFSLAAGHHAVAHHVGTYVWGDGTDSNVASSSENQFIVRANGGLWFGQASDAITPTIGAGIFISTSTGAYLSTGGTWTNASTRSTKDNVAPVDGQEILSRLVDLPIATWNYAAQDPAIRHIGPMAQDFHAAFGLGEDETHIATVDADGVAIAAIQGLYAENQELKARVDALESRLAALEEADGAAGTLRPPAGWLGLGGLLLLVGGVSVQQRLRAGGRG